MKRLAVSLVMCATIMFLALYIKFNTPDGPVIIKLRRPNGKLDKNIYGPGKVLRQLE